MTTVVQGMHEESTSHIENRIGEPGQSLSLSCLASALPDSTECVGVSIQARLKTKPLCGDHRPLFRRIMAARRRSKTSALPQAIRATVHHWTGRDEAVGGQRFLAASRSGTSPGRVTHWEHREYFTRY